MPLQILMKLQHPVFAKAEIVMRLIVQPSPAVFFLCVRLHTLVGKIASGGGIATTVLAKCGSSITPLTFPGVLLPLPSVPPSCCQAAYCYSGHACAKKLSFGGLFLPRRGCEDSESATSRARSERPRYLRERRREESVLDLFSP